MKYLHALTIMTLLIAGNTVLAQTGTILGTVTNSEGAPMEFVNISIEGTTKGTTTNQDGTYRIKNVEPGTHPLIFSAVGYELHKTEVEVLANRATTVRPIVLNEKKEQLSEIVVRGTKNKYIENTPSGSLRLKTALFKLPQNIQVITGDLLRDQQVTTMMEGVIRNVSGATMLEHWGHFARIHMRGFRLPAFRNGINLSDSWGPLAEDMSFVERIEFVKGPSGFMMSAGEPGGFYNVVTKKPTATPVAQVALTAGSFDLYRGTVDFGGKLTKDEKLLYRLNGLYQTADSHRGNEDARRFGLAPALTYNFSDKTSVTAELNYQQAESLIGSAYVFGPVSMGYGSLDRDFKNTDTNYPATDIRETTVFANFKHEISDDWSVEAQFSHLRYDQEGNSTWIWNFSDNGDIQRYISVWDALSLGTYFQTYLYGHVQTGSISHSLLGGIDYTDKEYWADWFQSEVIDEQPFNIFNPTYGNTTVPEFDRSKDVKDRVDGSYNGGVVKAFYVQDEIGFWENKIRLTLAGRYTSLKLVGKDDEDNKFTPRVGLSADITPSLTAYALYDQSFLGQYGKSFEGKSFDPVDAKDIEGGIKKSFFDGRLKVSLGAYQITKENVLVADPDHPDFSIQLGEVQSKGFEFDVQGEISPGLNLILNYANTDVEITEDSNPENIGNKVAGHARHMTNGWLNYAFPSESPLKGFGVSLGYQYQANRSSWAWGSDNKTDLPDYFRLDGGLFWRNDKFGVQLNVNNLLDEYLYSGANYSSYLYWQSEPGINGRLTLTYNIL
ncbi:MAG: TonB-dependent receptor [Cytophagales bacterium]|nr:TonB-dependent receptor [Cytophagales bacterium]